jgi:hypothetical protein
MTICGSSVSNGRVQRMACKLFVEFRKEYQKDLFIVLRNTNRM